MSNGKIAQVLCKKNGKKKEEIIQEGVGEGKEQEVRKGKKGEGKKRKYEKENNPGVLLFALKLLSPHFFTVYSFTMFE